EVPPSMKGRTAGGTELAEGPGHFTKFLEGKRFLSGRPGHPQANLDLEQQAADLISRRLQVLFAVVLAAGRGRRVPAMVMRSPFESSDQPAEQAHREVWRQGQVG